MKTVQKPLRTVHKQHLLSEAETSREEDIRAVHESIHHISMCDDSEKQHIYKLYSHLKSLGMSRNTIRMYLYLVTNGPARASDISKTIGIQRTECYNYLSQIMSRGLASASFDRPTLYNAVPIDQAIEILLSGLRTMAAEVDSHKHDYSTSIGKLVKGRSNLVSSYGYGVGSVAIEEGHYQHVVGLRPIVAKMTAMIVAGQTNVELILSTRMAATILHQDDIINALRDIVVGAESPRSQQINYKILIAAEGVLKEELIEALAPLSIEFTDNNIPNSSITINGAEVMIVIEANRLLGIWTTNAPLKDMLLSGIISRIGPRPQNISLNI